MRLLVDKTDRRNAMLRKYRLWFLVAIFGLLTGCSSTVDCDVVSYHTLDKPMGETVNVVPQDSELTGTPEFAFFSAQIEKQLRKIGYVPEGGGTSDLIFAIRYGTGDGPDEVARLPKCFTRYRYIYDDYGSPYYRSFECDDGLVDLKSTYFHFLALNVYRPTEPGDPGEVIYQGIANSVSMNDNIRPIMPYLIAALFDGFPSESGEVRNVAVDRAAVKK